MFICKTLNFRCRRLCGIFNLSAIALIMFAVSKKISLSADSDNVAPPP